MESFRQKSLAAAVACLFATIVTVARADSFSAEWNQAVAAAKRPVIGKVAIDEVKSQEPTNDFIEKTEEGKTFRYPLIKVSYASAAKLTDLVMKDNTVGNVYPGALLWSGPLAEGRIHPLPALHDRAPVHAAVSGATIASGEGAASPSFDFDGQFSSYQKILNERSLLIKNQAPKYSINFESANSSESAMLKAGLSASGWGAKLGWQLDMNSNQQESYALIAVDEVYYSASCDAPAVNAMVPIASIADDKPTADLMLQMIRENGEPVFVRSVDYGRRVYISIRANASAADLQNAINASYNGFGASVDASLKMKNEAIQNTLQAKAVVIGGNARANDDLVTLIVGDPKEFLKNVEKYLKASASFEGAVGVPVSFQASYVSDNSPMQVYETTSYSGKVPAGNRQQKGETLRVSYVDPLTKQSALTMDGQNASLLRSDWEVDSDDCTGVTVAYSVRIAEDQRSVLLSLGMEVRELEANGKYANKTHIRTAREFPIFTLADDDRRTIRDLAHIERQANSGEQIYRGVCSDTYAFPPTGYATLGSLTDVKVHFDGRGANDKNAQHFSAGLAPFEVIISDESAHPPVVGGTVLDAGTGRSTGTGSQKD